MSLTQKQLISLTTKLHVLCWTIRLFFRLSDSWYKDWPIYLNGDCSRYCATSKKDMIYSFYRMNSVDEIQTENYLDIIFGQFEPLGATIFTDRLLQSFLHRQVPYMTVHFHFFRPFSFIPSDRPLWPRLDLIK